MESGYFRMTDEDYTAALELARAEIKREQPKISEVDLETAALERANDAKRRHEHSFIQKASSTYELKSP